MSLHPAGTSGIFGLISDASNKDPINLKYRTLFLPKHGAVVVQAVEMIQYLKPALPENLRDIAEDVYLMNEKAMISTTSIKGKMLEMLTTNKQHITMNDPRMKRGILGGSGKLFGGGGDHAEQ